VKWNGTHHSVKRNHGHLDCDQQHGFRGRQGGCFRLTQVRRPIAAHPRRQLSATDHHRGKAGDAQCRQVGEHHHGPGFAGDGAKALGFRAVVRTDEIGVAGVELSVIAA
jgi:hypothetical protein